MIMTVSLNSFFFTSAEFEYANSIWDYLLSHDLEYLKHDWYFDLDF